MSVLIKTYRLPEPLQAETLSIRFVNYAELWPEVVFVNFQINEMSYFIMKIHKQGKAGNRLRLACQEFHSQTDKVVLNPLKNERVILSA